MRVSGERRYVPRLLIGALAGMLCTAAPIWSADSLAGSSSGGYGRLTLNLDSGTPRAQVSGSVLVLTFPNKTTLKPSDIVRALPGYISNGHADADGKTFRFALTQPLRLQSSSAGGKTAFDLIPPSFSGSPAPLKGPAKAAPPKPVDMENLEPLKVRSGAYQNFSRVVFDWPRNVSYSVSAAPGRLTLRFGAPVKPDFTALERQMPPWVKPAGWHIEGQSTIIELTTDSDSGYHDFRDGSHVVVDILAPKTDTGSYQPPGTSRPNVSSFRDTGGKNKGHDTGKAANVSTAQAEEIDKVASKLNNPKLPQPQVVAADGKPSATPSGMLQIQGKLARDRAELMIPGAASRGVAAFARGVTAWVVVQGAPSFDISKIKALQNGILESADTVASSGVSVLRLTLKKPVRIAAYADNGNLRVELGGAPPANVQNVTFTRGQDDAARAALIASLEGAGKTVALNDPGARDKLIAIPGTMGQAVLAERNFVDFTMLPTAAGVVVEPFVDDLTINIAAPRVEITRAGGLALSQGGGTGEQSLQPPSASEDSFLDFAHWGRMTGGSFLATERSLRAETARPGKNADQARLNLARFYLANDFGAEALGLINLMQGPNASMASPNGTQLQVMRAAADYQMGRYRDARTALADSAFDSDPHAALWRGLADAALENYESAAANLDRAAPVLSRYRSDIQAKAHLAAAEAALATGRREDAKKHIDLMPADMPEALKARADLVRARYYALWGDKRTADQLFASVERGNDPRAAAEALYYRIDAGLQSGGITPEQAINALERLRFRWRGDSLELKTLNKLATLYFKQKKWRDGLGDLRVMAKYFTGTDAASRAQDQMRTLFSDLFLRGRADNMPPADALGLFYDFIDLTPIGPDGDEMIRHMADRLTAVDLLGPAADLLQYQVTKRLDGMARAQVATKLAAVQLMDHKPQAALETLLTTRISAVPDDVAEQRMLLQARALADLKRWDEALDMIGVDKSADADRFRADVYWKSGNWSAAGQHMEVALGNRWNDATPLTDGERQQVLRTAVAYAMAGDENNLNRVRARYAALMNASPDGKAFGIVTQRTDMRGLAFREAAAQVAAVDTLKGFMKDMEKPAKK